MTMIHQNVIMLLLTRACLEKQTKRDMRDEKSFFLLSVNLKNDIAGVVGIPSLGKHKTASIPC